ncbi:MAG: hypothetical protein WBB43_23690 [Limnoraphis sp.]
MLELAFYSKNDQSPCYIEVPEDLYEWLIHSEFSKIGKSVPRKIKIDGEEETLPVVQLGKGNRKKLRNFFVEVIVEDDYKMLKELGDSPSKQEYQAATSHLKKLQEIRKLLENENYQYLQRVF